MTEQDEADDKSKNNRNLITLIFVVGFMLLCCIIFTFVIFCSLTFRLISGISKDVNPPHYGVFIKQNRGFLELEEKEIFDIPTEGEIKDALKISNSRPVIVVWRADVLLDYLVLYKLGQYTNEESGIKFNASPKENGIIEISPASSLEDGVYCLVQGNPLGVFLPGWCFEISTR